MSDAALLLLMRPGCHLCDDMLVALAEHHGGEPPALVQRNVDDDAVWRQRWGWKIPVLLDRQGEPVCITFFEADAYDEWRRDLARGSN